MAFLKISCKSDRVPLSGIWKQSFTIIFLDNDRVKMIQTFLIYGNFWSPGGIGFTGSPGGAAEPGKPFRI